MNQSQLIRDLKLEPLLHLMAGGGENTDLSKICRKRLLEGSGSAQAAIRYQNELYRMHENMSMTEDVYARTSRILESLIPFRNYLDPRNAGILSPPKKLGICLDMGIQIADGLKGIYKKTRQKEKAAKLAEQLAELKKLSHCQSGGIVELTGTLGEGLRPEQIRITRLKPLPSPGLAERRFFPNLFEKGRTDQTEYQEISDQSAEAFKMALSHPILRIVSAYTDSIEKELMEIHEDYGFAIGAGRLRQFLKNNGIPYCFPHFTGDSDFMRVEDLTELSLPLRGKKTEPNSIHLFSSRIVFITGSNQGGKTTFLRSIGQAQLLAASGLFVPAKEYTAPCQPSVFTHFPDQEEVGQNSGLLDRELRKLDAIINEITPGSLLLLNETFLTTTEYDGCEIGKEVIEGLAASQIKVFFVTHNYLLANSFYIQDRKDTAFLQAFQDEERRYGIRPGSPQRTVRAKKLYDEIVGS